jgi:hypothetical protein
VDEEEEATREFEDDDEEEGEGEDSEDEDEDIDHDEIILGNTTDVIISLSKVYGDHFLPYLTRLGPSLVKYLDETHPKSDQQMVIGCLSETFTNCTAAIPVYFADFSRIILQFSTSEDEGINRNCAYSIGVLAEHS